MSSTVELQRITITNVAHPLWADLGVTSMRKVFSVNELPWQNLRGLPGARGFEYKRYQMPITVPLSMLNWFVSNLAIIRFRMSNRGAICSIS